MGDYINAYWCESQNFGDALTPWLIYKLTGKFAVYTPPSKDIVTYMATGSMLDDDISNSIVWGCGIAWRHDIIRKPLEIRAVRGPISRQRVIECGHECPDVIGDPALLLPRLYMPSDASKYRLGIIPHYVDHGRVMDAYKDRESTKIIDIKSPIESVIDDMLVCDKIISSSLHGLIVAQAYGRPNLWVEFSDEVIGDGTKFVDFMLSVGIVPYKPTDLRQPTNLDNLAIPKFETKINLQKLIDACPFNNLKIL